MSQRYRQGGNTATGDEPGLDPESSRKLSELMDGAPWAEGLDWEDMTKLARYLHVREYAKNQAVFRQGDHDPFMCIILSGQVEITKRGPGDADEEKSLVRMGAGRAFGELAVIDGQARSASVFARGDSRLLVLTKENLDRLARDNLNLAFKVVCNLAKMMSRRMRQTSERLVEFL